MKIETRFKIGDEVYYVNKDHYDDVIINKYIIDDIKICKGANDVVNVEYSIYNCKHVKNKHHIGENCKYLFTNIDDALTYIKNYLEKGE
jgi:hypothetical protein